MLERPRWLICTCFQNLDWLNWADMIPTPRSAFFFSSCCWISIVGLFCGEALVKWAIIPVGESDDDFWQNAATAPCQTIRAIAISSHGHARARRLTPQTRCFSLRSQTWERLDERSGRWWRARGARVWCVLEVFFQLQIRGFGNKSGSNLSESRVSTSAELLSKVAPPPPATRPALPPPQALLTPVARRHRCSQSKKIRERGRGGEEERKCAED